MSKSWDDYADGWDENESAVLYSEEALKTLLSTTELKGISVLDFGCGTGLLTEKLSHHANSVVAIDPSEKMMSVLLNKNLKNVSTITNELTQQVIDGNENLNQCFDLIVASSSLGFVPNFNEVLLLLKKLLKQGGRLVQWDWLGENETSGSGFTKESIESAYKQAGFTSYTSSVPFSIGGSGESMKVIMGIATKA